MFPMRSDIWSRVSLVCGKAAGRGRPMSPEQIKRGARAARLFCGNGLPVIHALIWYALLPSARLMDFTFNPIPFPRLPLRNPRTECACHCVAFMISAKVAPLVFCSMAITSAFLLPGRATGLGARDAFFALFAFFLWDDLTANSSTESVAEVPAEPF